MSCHSSLIRATRCFVLATLPFQLLGYFPIGVAFHRHQDCFWQFFFGQNQTRVVAKTFECHESLRSLGFALYFRLSITTFATELQQCLASQPMMNHKNIARILDAGATGPAVLWVSSRRAVQLILRSKQALG
jgi:hypothetical protein